VIPSVLANVNEGGHTTPATHTAWINVGATGVVSSQLVPTSWIVNVAASSSTCVQPDGICAHSYPSVSVAVTVTVVSRAPT
jgi:hypothetical protein